MKRNIFYLGIFAFCLVQSAFAQVVTPVVASVSQNTPTDTRAYLVGPGDVLSVKVLSEPDFSLESITVDEDGKIEVPFSDTPVIAQCRTERELRGDITKLLSKYIRTPQVSVAVKERNSRLPATVYGEVRQPQRFVMTKPTRLLELLSYSGGVTPSAGGIIQVVRTKAPMCASPDELNEWNTAQNTDGGILRLYSLSSIRQGSNESNPLIYPGDLVQIQKAAPVYIIGEVLAFKELLLPENGLTLSEALAQVGGTNRQAKTKDIIIHRLKPNSKDRDNISVNYDLIRKGQQKDVILQPEDIVEVGKAKKKFTDVILDIAAGTARTAAQAPVTRL